MKGFLLAIVFLTFNFYPVFGQEERTDDQVLHELDAHFKELKRNKKELQEADEELKEVINNSKESISEDIKNVEKALEQCQEDDACPKKLVKSLKNTLKTLQGLQKTLEMSE